MMKKMVLLPYDRYKRLLSDSNKPVHDAPEKDVHDQTLEPFVQNTDTFSDDAIIQYFPKLIQARARVLLTYLKPVLGWNDKLEIIISGQLIPNSNLIDLVKVQLKEYKDFQPVGIAQFQKLLADSNIPWSLLISSKRVQTGTGIIPPPPGVQVKRKHIKAVSKKWLKL